MNNNSLEPFDENPPPPLKIEKGYVYVRQGTFGWKQWLFLAVLCGAGLLFAFGFLMIAGIILLAGIVINIVAFIIRKLS